MMITETKYIFLRLMLVIPRIYKRYTLSPHFSLKKMNIDKWQKRLICLTRRTMFTEALKLALDYGLILEKNHGIIEFNQEAWSNPYIDMNTELTKKAKNYFEKDFKLMNNSVFGNALRIREITEILSLW